MTQTAYPASDISRSGVSDWIENNDCSGGALSDPIYSSINSLTIGNPCSDDITGCGQWNIQPNSNVAKHSKNFVVTLQSLLEPGSRTNHKVKMKIRNLNGQIDACVNPVEDVNVTVVLYEGGSAISSVTQLYNQPANLECGFCGSNVYDNLEFDFADLDVESIVDYTNLRLQITVARTVGGNMLAYPFIGQTHLEIPDSIGPVSLDFSSRTEPQKRTYNRRTGDKITYETVNS